MIAARNDVGLELPQRRPLDERSISLPASSKGYDRMMSGKAHFRWVLKMEERGLGNYRCGRLIGFAMAKVH